MNTSAKIKEYWNGIGDSDEVNWHIAHIADEAAFLASGEKTAKLLFGKDLQHLPTMGDVLEIGCGRGRILRYLAERRSDQRFYGCDVSEKMIEQAYLTRNTFYIAGDGLSLCQFPARKFSCVYSYTVFQHLPEKIFLGYLMEAARVLVRNGTFVFQMQIGEQKKTVSESDFRTIRYYSIDYLSRLVGKYFHIDSMIGGPQSVDFVIRAHSEFLAK